jgi:hypothetical protein
MLRNALLLPAWLLLPGLEARSDDSIAADTVQAVKRAAVFLRVEVDGKEGSGSGFVVQREGDRALLITNHHVVAGTSNGPKPGPDFPALPTNTKVTVVFDSGTKAERSGQAEILAVDSRCDLAVLRVTGIKDLPEPIRYAEPPRLVETMAVWTFGFPFGQALSISKGQPSITVGKAFVSSLRHNDDGELVLVQIDGSLNPGHSGGPVVDSKGRLVGVAVATIKSSGIGFIIPAAEIGPLFEGRVGGGRVAFLPAPGGKLKARVELALVDPLHHVRSVRLHYVLAPKNEAEPKGKEPLDRRPGCKTIPLLMNKNVAVGELPVEGPAGGKMLVQAVWEVEGGKASCGLIGSHVIARNTDPGRPNEIGTRAGRTRVLGGGFGRDPYTDAAPEQALLVGLEVGLGKFFDIDVVHSVRAVFRAGDKESVGPQHGTNLTRVTRLVAKPGYAVGAMTVKTGANADGLSLTFMRINGDKLEPTDSYDSEWLGDPRPGRKTVLTGNGRPVVGIIGTRSKENNTGIGLLFDRKSQEDDPARPNPVKPSDRGKDPGDNSGGREFTPQNGQYTVRMPAGVRSRQRTRILTIKSHRVPIESAESTLNDGTNYLVASIGIPAVVMRQIPSGERFDTFRDILVKEVRGKVTGEKDLQQGDAAGKEYQIEGGHGAVRVQLYLKGGWVLYALVDGKSKDIVTSSEADAFFRTFKMLDKI